MVSTGCQKQQVKKCPQHLSMKNIPNFIYKKTYKDKGINKIKQAHNKEITNVNNVPD